MQKDWTIDTFVLYEAGKGDWNAIAFLNSILTNEQRVTFDQNGHIEGEYRRCIGRLDSGQISTQNVERWLKHIKDKLAQYFPGRLQRKHRVALDRIGFHNNDMPFVKVCQHTISKKLVSEDTHYNEDVKSYLLDNMKIEVIPIVDALAE